MDHVNVGKMWDANAEAWTKLARQGYDVCRDLVNTPAFLAILPEIRALNGLDIGCGEGYNTRQFAQRGASMQAVDISETFLRHARQSEAETPLGIRYTLASAAALPFANGEFDFATATMSLMDVPEHDTVLTEAFRVLKPGGFLQFSITHPCFQTPKTKWVLDAHGRRVAMECADYFQPVHGEIEEWSFNAAPESARAGLPNFRIPTFTRTLSSWMNLLATTGFVFEEMQEPYPSDAALAQCPSLYDMRIIAYFLIVRARKR